MNISAGLALALQTHANSDECSIEHHSNRLLSASRQARINMHWQRWLDWIEMIGWTNERLNGPIAIQCQCYPWRSYLHWACPSQDSHCSWCRPCPQETGTHLVWIRRIDKLFIESAQITISYKPIKSVFVNTTIEGKYFGLSANRLIRPISSSLWPGDTTANGMVSSVFPVRQC